MKRMALAYLQKWLDSKNRKPIVVRGARQVGKTWLIRHLSEVTGKTLFELNFEKQPQLKTLFNTNDPRQILINIEAFYNQKVSPDNSLLFLDEIQSAPELLTKLRWFAEDLPELPVLTAGSLLEFILSDHAFSMPVGRISYLHLEPLSFEEFLWAKEKEKLYEFLTTFQWDDDIPFAIHQQLMELFKEYIIIGGLPAAVSSWHKDQSLDQVSQIHHDLLATYRDDFSKYAGKIELSRLDEVLSSIPRLLGKKFVYSQVNKDIPSASIKQALALLNKARLCHTVNYSSANGVPLDAEKKEKFFKAIFLDVGLASTTLGFKLHQMRNIEEIILVNQGGISEQIVGQLLRTIEPFYVEPALYYWRREQSGSSAEIDYLIQHENGVIPVEVKSGSTGTLKSLHVFMALKRLPLAVRINSDLPNKTYIDTKTQTGNSVHYQLLSLPFYLVGQLHRLI